MSRGVSFTDLGDGIERLATGGLEQAEMQRVFDAGYSKGLADSTRKRADELTDCGQRLDGSNDWEAISLFCQREKAHLEARHHQFIDDMAGRLVGAANRRRSKGLTCSACFASLAGG